MVGKNVLEILAQQNLATKEVVLVNILIDSLFLYRNTFIWILIFFYLFYKWVVSYQIGANGQHVPANVEVECKYGQGL